MAIISGLPCVAEQEAAVWFSKINAASATSGELLEFYAWRKRPENDAAYRTVERFWFSSASLRDDVEIARLLQEAKERALLSTGKSSVAIWSLVAGATATAAAALILFVVVRPEFGAASYQTAVGEQRTVALADGTRVKLDTDSHILVRLTTKARSIDLRKGQAFFDVTHIPARPLTVTVGHTFVYDLGTRFDIRREAQAVQITLVEGALQVGGPGAKAKSWTLAPGEQMTTGPKPDRPHSVDTAVVTGWTAGQLTFDNIPLSEAVREVNRYTLRKLEIDAGSASDFKISGTFDPRDTRGFIKAVTKLYPLQAQTTSDGDVVLAQPGSGRDGQNNSKPLRVEPRRGRLSQDRNASTVMRRIRGTFACQFAHAVPLAVWLEF